jgi:HD-GYP domain-containing protein (c-di-GMP phosphodiesterase class II)
MLWRLSWWDYHVYLLAGFTATAWAVIVEYRRSRSLAQVVSGISVRDPLEQIARGHPEALDTLIGAVEAKDRYTHGHSRRVAELSSRIGITLGLEPEALRGLHQGASLHDVGKISVPDQILNKPGELSDDEWEAIKEHPVVGWGLAQRAPSLRDSLAAIRHHHERWDGTGYPDRLGGDAIPLAGRIVAVADVWDALTSDRAYRPAWDPERAISHIAGGAGILFDPECVEAFLDVMTESGLFASSTSADVEAMFRESLERHRASAGS